MVYQCEGGDKKGASYADVLFTRIFPAAGVRFKTVYVGVFIIPSAVELICMYTLLLFFSLVWLLLILSKRLFCTITRYNVKKLTARQRDFSLLSILLRLYVF